jgi:hypothetical protein
MENDEDEDEVAMMEAHTASMMDAIADGVEVELQFREDYEPGKTTYQIFVKTLTDQTITLDINILDDVDSIKAMVEAKTGIPADKQRLTCGGHRLEDVGANIKKEITLHLMLSLLGGMGKRGRGGDGAAGAAGGLSELRNAFGRGMKMIEGNRVSDAANVTYNNMMTIIALLARNKVNPVQEVLGALSVEHIGDIQTAIVTHTTLSTRYRAITKALLSDTLDSIELCSQQLRDCDKLLIDGVSLLLSSQYGKNGIMSWEQLSVDLTRIATDKALRLGAAAGAAAATAAAAAATAAADDDIDLLG